MNDIWCSGQGTEVELLDEPFRIADCPSCGRRALGAIDVRREISQTFGKVPKHRAQKIGPDDIPSARFQSHDHDYEQLVMRRYYENRRKP